MRADEPEVPQGLVYVNDTMPGILRRRHGKGFAYRHASGAAIAAADRQRIRQLAIPPAYRDVWICALPEGHLQATGRDDRGRKQYRYHPAWGDWRAGSKYGQLAAFGDALPRLRRRIQRDLRADAGDLAFTLAALTLLIDRAFLRVGSDAYARENRTFGAATLLNRHLTLADGVIRLRFRAKGGKTVTHRLRDSRLHRILQEIGDLPGRHLFTCIGEDGTPRPVTSQQVNAYIAEGSALPGATAKTFRTWGGTLAAFALARQTKDRLTVRMMAEAAAARLANTPAVCRSSYIHPSVLDLAGCPPEARIALLDRPTPAGDALLRAEERHLLAFLHNPVAEDL